ncbi:MAG: helix-turn-helix transcriptional regulator [Chloroflexi bacterium]|nr:helix-turn-helix transcriptional regulator [Chloroflexota bacterium]
MIVDLSTRPSDLPFVHAIYEARSIGGGSFISNATTQWEMVITRQFGRITLSLRGPETQASPAPIPEDAEFLGVIFEHGTFMPNLPGCKLVDEEIHVSENGKNSFQLFGETWQFPTFENIDTFVERLTRKDLVARDQVVVEVLSGRTHELSLRSIQRRFLHVTGLTYKAIQQVERARKAVELLQSGTPILDATHQAGYFDQAHLTNSLRRYYGQTPRELIKSEP